MSQNWISFPNLGITFNLNPVAFMIGSTEVKWSLIFIVISVIVGFFIYFKAVKKQNFNIKQITIVTAITSFFTLIGARIVYVIPTNLAAMDQFYYETGVAPETGYFNTFYKIIAFWDKSYGGLNLYGGLIFGLLALAILSKIEKWPMAKYLDSVVFALPAAIAVHALGYISNQSSFGRNSDSLLAINGNLIEKWVNVLRMNDIARGGVAIGPNVKWVVGNPVSPTPIYEVLGCLAVILIVWLLSKFMIFSGEKFLWSFGLYSLVRAFIENSRVDALLFWNMRVVVMFAVIAILTCAVLIVILRWQVKEGRLRSISLYVDSHKNNGFENDTFIQKVYRGEAVDVIPDQTSANTPRLTRNEESTQKATPEPSATEPKQSEGKGQIWTLNDEYASSDKSSKSEGNDGDTH